MRSYFLFFTLLVCGFSFGQTAVYTVTSTSAATTSGTAPTGSSATYSQTYTTMATQITGGNSATLTLIGYAGYKITDIVLEMRSNSSSGAGNMSATAGSTTIASIATATFLSSSWNGAWSTTYVNITKTPSSYDIATGENVVITINATVNSLYIQKYTITYAPVTVTPTITATPATLTGFNYIVGNGPSGEQTFAVSGSNLTNDILVTAPTNYEVSTTSGGTFTNTVSLTPTLGTVSSTTIYTRLKASLAVATYNGVQVDLTSTGAATKTVDLSGSVSPAPTPTIVLSPATLSGFTYAVGSGPSPQQSFTASGSNLTANLDVTAPINYEVSLTSGSGYGASVTLNQISGTVAATTIYTRLKTGLPVGTYNETITATSTGAPNQTVALSGNVSNSKISDISTDNSFSYPTNIDYLLYQTSTITNTSNSVGVMRFLVRDGGSGFSDLDGVATVLTDISFSVTNAANIRSAALFSGNSMLVNNPTISGSTVSFAGLSPSNFTIPDASNGVFTLRITFLDAVTDNQQLQFTVLTAVANPAYSTFATLNAGGAFSSTTADINRIEVVADRLAFLQQPTTTPVSTPMTPAPTVQAVDIKGNRDLDFTTATSVTSTGVLTGTPVSGTVAAGLITFSSLVHSVQDTFRTLTVTTTGLLVSNSVTSANFDINDVPSGTYRTTSGGTWPAGATPATWERLTAGTWAPATPPANSTNLLIIRHNITSAGAFAASGGTSMKVEGGGRFNAGHNCTFKELLIENNARFYILVPAVDIVMGTGTVTVNSGGRVIANSGTFNLDDGFWQGIENFKTSSILEIQNWDWDDTTSGESLIGSGNVITPNANGYYFGNIEFTGTPTKAFKFVYNIGDHKLCENNLTINNQTNLFSVLLTIRNANVEIGGNLIVNSNKFAFANVGSSDLVHTVKGNILLNGGTVDLNQQSAGGATVTVNLEGNLTTLPASTLTSTDAGCKIAFNKVGAQTVSIAGGLGINAAFEVGPTSTTRLINQNLDLTNASNKFTVLSDGVLEFNYFDISGPGDFIQQPTGVLKITSANGVNASGATGNVINTGTRTFSQSGHFYYVGNVTPQSTGTAMTLGPTSKLIVVDKTNTTDVVNLTQTTGTSNDLRIVKGHFVETEAVNIYGSGTLTMSATGRYLSAVTSANFPKLIGPYTLDSGSIIELNAFGTQTLKGGSVNLYRNLTFSKSGTKTISSATPNVLGTILISDAAILDVDNKTMGGSGTNLTMTGSSEYRTAGVSVKPDASGTYNLGVGTKVSFTSGSTALPISTLQEIRLAPNYYNIDIVGNNVGTNTLTGGIKLQNGGTFNVTSSGIFKHSNTAGFSGVAQAAISNATTPIITLQPNSTVDFAGANQIITIFNAPYYANLNVSGSGIKTLQNPTLTTVNENLDVVSGKLLVEADKVITVNKAVKISTTSGEFEIENNGQLIQIDEVDANSGIGSNFKVNRVAKVKNFDYVYWSSPATAVDVSTLPNNNRYYWDPIYTNPNGTQGYWLPATGTMLRGRGYISRFSNASPTAPIATTVSLIGTTPFNGQFSTGISRGTTAGINDCLNLIGNPYPSALDADLFLAANPVIEGSVRIWMHGNSLAAIASPFYQNFTSNYNINDYIIYNGTAATVPAAFSGDIASGQGFFVRMLEAGETSGSSATATSSVNFKNSFRKAFDGSLLNNTEFYKTNTANVTSEKSRIWLDLISPDNTVSKIVVGYVAGATAAKDRLYDAVIDVSGFSFYSVCEDYPLAIQGRALPFEVTDSVPLGVVVQTAGAHTIAISSVDGLFSSDNQNIYVEDLVLGKTHNIKLSPYTFQTDAGTFNNRFVLKYTTESLSTNEVALQSNLAIAISENQVMLKASEEMANVKFYDMLGRLVYSSKINSTEFTTDAIQTNGVLVARIKFANGQTVDRKLML